MQRELTRPIVLFKLLRDCNLLLLTRYITESLEMNNYLQKLNFMQRLLVISLLLFCYCCCYCYCTNTIATATATATATTVGTEEVKYMLLLTRERTLLDRARGDFAGGFYQHQLTP